MTLRSFCPEDLDVLETFDFFSALQLRHHGGADFRNAWCVVEDPTAETETEGFPASALLGVGFFILPTLGNPLGLRKAELTLSVRPEQAEADAKEIRRRLVEALLMRFRIIRAEHPETNLILRICTESTDLPGMAFHLEQGASLEHLIPVLARDLSRLDPEGLPPLPEGVVIEPLVTDDAGISDYIAADLRSSTVPDSEAEMRFRSGNPTYTCFVARVQGQVIGSSCVWDMGEASGATENIFVAPEHRRQGIAQALVERACAELRRRGKTEATLSVMGNNTSALRLYHGLGYRLAYNLVEIVYR